MPPAHTRRYAVFISYRHADNKEMGRQWANWLHEALESYEVPPDLVGATNQRGELVPASLYPVFRDEEELPADADLSANIRRALENSGLLVVICSPRAVQSRFVADEIRYFKELGKSDCILALIIDGEPNVSDDPAKLAKFSADTECFPEPLRFGISAKDDPKRIDWTIRTEPLAADVRPGGLPEQGWTNAAAYREHLGKTGRLDGRQTVVAVQEYAGQLELARLKIAAGALGLPLGVLTQRDKAVQAAKAKRRAQVLRRWLVAVTVLACAAALAGVVAWRQNLAAQTQTLRALKAEEKTASQLLETERQLERYKVERGRALLASAGLHLGNGESLLALMLAGQAVGFDKYGRIDSETTEFKASFPLLLAERVTSPPLETERQLAQSNTSEFTENIRPTLVPLWVKKFPGPVDTVLFSPCCTKVLVISEGKASLWNVATGTQLETPFLRGIDAITATFSNDGRLLAIARDQTAGIWDVATGSLVAELSSARSIGAFSFTQDDSKLVCVHISNESPEGTIQTFHTSTGSLAASTPWEGEAASCYTIAPNGLTIANGDYVFPTLWSAPTGAPIAIDEDVAHERTVTKLAFSSNGKWLASGSIDYRVLVCDVKTGKLHAELEFTPAPYTEAGVESLSFSPDGSYIACGSVDEMIRIWHVGTKKLVASAHGHAGTVSGLSFAPDGSRLASGSADGTVKVWDAAVPKEFGQLGKSETDSEFSPDGTMLASGANNGSITLWDTATGIGLATLEGYNLAGFTFSSDSKRIAALEDDQEKTVLWDVTIGKSIDHADVAEVARVRQQANPTGRVSPDHVQVALVDFDRVFMAPSNTGIDLAVRLRSGMLSLSGDRQELKVTSQNTSVIHARNDAIARLADPAISPALRAELQMSLCASACKDRVAVSQWQNLLKSPSSVPSPNSPIRRLYLSTLISAAHRDQSEHARLPALISHVSSSLTSEMMTQPVVTLGIAHLVSTLKYIDDPEVTVARIALINRLREVAPKNWLDTFKDELK